MKDSTVRKIVSGGLVDTVYGEAQIKLRKKRKRERQNRKRGRKKK